MTYIWYIPHNKTYQVGNEIECNVQRAKASSTEDLVILYELDELTHRRAEKMVKELNSVNTELNL